MRGFFYWYGTYKQNDRKPSSKRTSGAFNICIMRADPPALDLFGELCQQ